MDLIKRYQGWPLGLIEKTSEINGTKLTEDDVKFLKRLAQDGAVKPPSITTSHAGNNYFIFTPTPGEARLSPSKREIYERAMALVASVRQGQFLPKQYAIKWPVALLRALKRKGYLDANTEAFEQYRKLTVLRVGRLVDIGGGFHRFYLNESEESQQALDIAIELVEQGGTIGTEVDEDIRLALQKDIDYIESIVSSQNLRQRESVTLTEEQKDEIDSIFLGGVSYN